MSRVVQSRFDEETDAILHELKKLLGKSESELLREGIRALSSQTPRKRKRRLTGLGKYSSGICDSATNPKYMDGYGT